MRTKYDRLFERKNQNILSEHYTKLIDHGGSDSDDEFHLNRDKVLLDEQPDVKRRRKAQEEEQFLQPSDEEIYDQSDSEGEEDFYDAQADQQSGEASDLEQFGGEDEDEEDEELETLDGEEDDELEDDTEGGMGDRAAAPKAKKKRKKKKRTKRK